MRIRVSYSLIQAWDADDNINREGQGRQAAAAIVPVEVISDSGFRNWTARADSAEQGRVCLGACAPWCVW